MISPRGLKENCTQKMIYPQIIKVWIKKKKFQEQIWVPAPQHRIGVSADVFVTYDVV